jgi:peptidoglycan/LPS O-acetylase OafA/YrhL
LVALFALPWFQTTGYGQIHGHRGVLTGWETYTVIRYFLLWCGVGAFILPWMVARRHEVDWRRGEMTAVHGLIGIVLLVLAGIGFPPGQPTSEIHVRYGYLVALVLMVVYVVAGASSADHHVPIPRKPPGI